jgi:purine nucleosidase
MARKVGGVQGRSLMKNRFNLLQFSIVALLAFNVVSGTKVFAETEAPSTLPPNVIFDTDMWSDVDDAMALAMLHVLQDRHEVNLVAVTVSTEEKWCASYVDLVDTFYGHSMIPIGIVHDGMNTEAFRRKFPQMKWPVTEYTREVAEKRDQAGKLIYPRRFASGTKVPESVSVLRKVLAAQPDGSVVMIQVGYSTNLARLLDSDADEASVLKGRDLIRKKVRLLSVMAGNFGEATIDGKVIAKGSPEFNLQSDIPAAQRVFLGWPTPIVASGFEVGLRMLYPAYSIEHDYSYVENHPIADAYRFLVEDTKTKWPHDHATFDLTAVLYAARPDGNYFDLSKPGKIIVQADGSSRFEESAEGAHRYLILNESERARTLEAMVMLASEPPAKQGSPTEREGEEKP